MLGSVARSLAISTGLRSWKVRPDCCKASILGAFLCKRPDLMGWWKDLALLSFLQWNFVQNSFRTLSFGTSDRLHVRSWFLGDFKGCVNSCLKRRWEDKPFRKWDGTNHVCCGPRWIRITYYHTWTNCYLSHTQTTTGCRGKSREDPSV